MGGHVYECCSTRWDDEHGNPHNAGDGREDMKHERNLYRVLRGARCSDTPEHTGRVARCGYRNYYNPASTYNEFGGFRCVTPHTFSPMDEVASLADSSR